LILRRASALEDRVVDPPSRKRYGGQGVES